MTKKGKRLVSRIALTEKIRDAIFDFAIQQPSSYGRFVSQEFAPIEDWEVVEFYKVGDERNAKNEKQRGERKEWFHELDYEDRGRIERYLERKGWKRTSSGWK